MNHDIIEVAASPTKSVSFEAKPDSYENPFARIDPFAKGTVINKENVETGN